MRMLIAALAVASACIATFAESRGQATSKPPEKGSFDNPAGYRVEKVNGQVILAKHVDDRGLVYHVIELKSGKATMMNKSSVRRIDPLSDDEAAAILNPPRPTPPAPANAPKAPPTQTLAPDPEDDYDFGDGASGNWQSGWGGWSPSSSFSSSRSTARKAPRTTARKSPPLPEFPAMRFLGGMSPGTTATGIPLHVGPRGGVYHYSASGNKVYQKKK